MHLEFLKNIKSNWENERPLVSLICFCLHFNSILRVYLNYVFPTFGWFILYLTLNTFVLENYHS